MLVTLPRLKWPSSRRGLQRDFFQAAQVELARAQVRQQIHVHELIGPTPTPLPSERFAQASRLMAREGWQDRKAQKPFRIEYEVAEWKICEVRGIRSKKRWESAAARALLRPLRQRSG